MQKLSKNFSYKLVNNGGGLYMKIGDKRNYKQKGFREGTRFSKNQIKQTIEKRAYNESGWNNKDGEQYE